MFNCMYIVCSLDDIVNLKKATPFYNGMNLGSIIIF